MAIERLTDAQIQDALKAVPEWSETGGSIQRTYKFADFAQSMTFVKQVADAAEAAQHHPDILIRWNKVTLTLSTHDAGGITQKDFDLASRCDAFAAALCPNADPPSGNFTPTPTVAPKTRKKASA